MSCKQIYNFKLYSYAVYPKLSAFLLALSINNHALLYTHINTYNIYHKKYT